MGFGLRNKKVKFLIPNISWITRALCLSVSEIEPGGYLGQDYQARGECSTRLPADEHQVLLLGLRQRSQVSFGPTLGPMSKWRLMYL